MKRIFEKLKGKQSHKDNVLKESNTQVNFGLLYKNSPVGILSYEDDAWVFYYTEVFKNQNKISAIVGFPDKNKVYKSKELWPFFASRIPGVNQPMVKKLVEQFGEKVLTEVELLKHFGKHTIANPFTLDSDFKLTV